MKRLKRKIITAALIASAFCLSMFPANALTDNVSLSGIEKNAAASNYRIPCGSFLQHWLTGSWSDTRWQLELKTMKEAGMEYVVFDPSVCMNASGVAYTLYPSQIPEFREKYIGDFIEPCLRNCEKAGVKVFIALNQDAEFEKEGHFWTMGWKLSKTQPDVCTDYWRKNAEISNKIADELYSLYKSRYKNAFYGWYWVHEFWNYTLCTNAYENKDPNTEKYKDKVAPDPTVYTDIIAKEALNPVLEHLTKIDSSMPMLFSSFYNPTLCKPESLTRLMSDIFKNTNFRDGDIWAPMDGMGGGLMSLDILDTWTAAAKKAADVNPKLHFWINNEEQVINIDPETGNALPQDAEVALINRAVKQIEITSKYSEQNVFFTWNHYYSPYVALKGFNETYMQYVKTGSIEKNAPSAVDKNEIKISKDKYNMYKISWKAPEDDVGIAIYNIYKNNELVSHLFPSRPGYSKPTLATFCTTYETGEYEIEALDFAGNASPKVKFMVNDEAIAGADTTTITDTTATETTNSSTVSSDSTHDTVEQTDASLTDSETTASSDTKDVQKSESPKTGSSIPAAAVMITILAASIGLTVKLKKSK